LSKKLVVLTLIALFFITLILRPPIAQIGPLLHEITGDLKLGPTEVGLLASAPVFTFGAGAFLAPWLLRRFGLNHAILLMLAIIFASIVLRSWFGYSVLLIGTLVIGLAIAITNVLLPTFLRVDFPKQTVILTSGYTTMLAITASVAAAISVPVSETLGGWELSLLITAPPALLAVLFWYPRIREAEPHVRIPAHSAKADTKAVYGSLIAWSSLAFFGIQSMNFYVVLSWLPTMLISIGVDPGAAGGFLGLATAIGIPTAMLLAPIMNRLKSISWLALGFSVLSMTGFASLSLFLAAGNPNNTLWLVISCVLVSVGQTATFPLSLTIISTRAHGQSKTTVLSAMSQGWGYLLSGVGVFAIGAFAVSTGSWATGVMIIVFTGVLQAAAGFYGGRNRYIE
jgi:CP family cyanate transporter-like MFS transporter